MGRRDPDMMLLDPGADLTAMERAHPAAARAYKKHLEAASKMGLCMYCKGALSPPQANWAWVEMTDTLTSVSALCFDCIGKMGGLSNEEIIATVAAETKRSVYKVTKWWQFWK